jgi:hypothetical protein
MLLCTFELVSGTQYSNEVFHGYRDKQFPARWVARDRRRNSSAARFDQQVVGNFMKICFYKYRTPPGFPDYQMCLAPIPEGLNIYS